MTDHPGMSPAARKRAGLAPAPRDEGLEDAHAALAAALLWLDGEYATKPREEFNRDAWAATARTGLVALVAARRGQPASAPLSEDGRSRLRDNTPGVAAPREPLDAARMTHAWAILVAETNPDRWEPDRNAAAFVTALLDKYEWLATATLADLAPKYVARLSPDRGTPE